MFFQLHITSKDKKMLMKFLKVLFVVQKNFSTWKIVSSINKTDVITVLKSPHINKTAQEQFEYRFYKKKILINSFKPFVFLYVLKKLKGLGFSGLLLKIIKISNKSKMTKKMLKLFIPKNIILKKINFNIKNLGFLEYIRLFDCFGEILLKEKYLSK